MKRYDTAVVGAGIAGLITANYLAQAGKNVILIDQNHQPGGNMSGFRRQGYTFDGGNQSFESMGVVFPILDELGLYRREDFQQSRFRFISDDFDFQIDSIDSAEAALQEAFPEETGLPVLFKEIREVSRFLQSVCTPESFPLLQNPGAGSLLNAAPWLPKLMRWMTFRERERQCSVIRNPALRRWFTNIGYYRMTYLFFAGFWHLWANDYWYPRGGMQAFMNRLASSFASRGGTVRWSTTVSGFSLKGSKVNAVETADGERIEADSVVYAGDYKALLSKLLPEGVFPARKAGKLKNTRLTESLVNVYLGIDSTPEETAGHMQGQHVFVFPNYDVHFPHAESPRNIHSKMWVTANFTGDRNPDMAPPGKSSLVLQTYSSRNWQNAWRNGGGTLPRTEAYQDLKREVGYELVHTAERIFPGLKQRISYLDVGTPLSAERFTMNSEGSSGGWCYDDQVSPVYKRLGKNLFQTPLKNLYAAGHYTLWPGGVISAVQSGKMVANMVLERPVFSPAFEQKSSTPLSAFA